MKSTPVPVKAYFFTKDEEAKLLEMYENYNTLAEIAKELQKSEGAIQQKVLRMKLEPRDCNLVRMVKHWGHHILVHGKDRETIRLALKAERIKTMAENKRKLEAKRQAAISNLKGDLMAGVERNTAIRKAHEAGATLTQIGLVVGMTKQGVGFIIKPLPERNRSHYGYGKQQEGS